MTIPVRRGYSLGCRHASPQGSSSPDIRRCQIWHRHPRRCNYTGRCALLHIDLQPRLSAWFFGEASLQSHQLSTQTCRRRYSASPLALPFRVVGWPVRPVQYRTRFPSALAPPASRPLRPHDQRPQFHAHRLASRRESMLNRELRRIPNRDIVVPDRSVASATEAPEPWQSPSPAVLSPDFACGCTHICRRCQAAPVRWQCGGAIPQCRDALVAAPLLSATMHAPIRACAGSDRDRRFRWAHWKCRHDPLRHLTRRCPPWTPTIPRWADRPVADVWMDPMLPVRSRPR